MVTGALVNLAFSAEYRLLWEHREAVGFDAAVTATLTHRLVDHHPTISVTHFSFFTTAPFFGCTGLLVDNDRGSFELSELQHQGLVLIPMGQAKTRYGVKTSAPVLRGIRDQRDAPHPFAAQLTDQIANAQRAIDRLPASHRDGVVIEDLVGDIHPGGDRRTNRQHT